MQKIIKVLIQFSTLKAENMLYFFLEINMESTSSQNTVTEPVSNSVLTPTTQSNRNWIIPFFSFFILLLLASTGYLYYQNQQLKKMLVSYQPQITPNPTATVDPTANWKTYTNTKYGYNFKYPETWYVYDKGTSTGLTELKNPMGIVVVSPNQVTEIPAGDANFSGAIVFQSNTGAVIKDNIDKNAYKVDETTIGGQPALKTTAIGNLILGNPSTNYYVGPNYQILSISFENQDLTGKHNRIFDQILSTFKFLGQTANDDRSQLTKYLTEQYYNQGKQFGKTQDQVVIVVNKLEGNYATGTGSFTTGGGDVWFTAKVNGSWFLVEQTQEPPSCKLMTQYTFPKSIYGECIEK